MKQSKSKDEKRKYPSCTANQGQWCNKHQCVHIKQDEESLEDSNNPTGVNVLKSGINTTSKPSNPEMEKALAFYRHLHSHIEVIESDGLCHCKICGKDENEIFIDSENGELNAN